MKGLSFDLFTLISVLDKEKKAKEGEGDMSDLFKLRRAIIWWLMVACCQRFQDKLRQTRITLSPLPIIHQQHPLLLCSCKVMWFTSLWFTFNSWPDRSGLNIYVYLSVDLFEFACLYWPLIFRDLGEENQPSFLSCNNPIYSRKKYFERLCIWRSVHIFVEHDNIFLWQND